MTSDIRIVPARQTDLPRLQAHLPAGGPAKHDDRLRRQSCGEVVYLIAWLDERPVGHALIKWDGCADEPVAARLDGPCPDIEDLYVADDVRQRGIGTQLLAKAERRVRQRGMRRAGLSVGTETNEATCRLYERLGYRDAGFGPFVDHGAYVDAGGQHRQWHETCIYLIKDMT
jgi:GNAT superfamily N-acetyltransferase